MSTLGDAFSLKVWINEHRDILKPPVGNDVVWKDSDMMVMIIGGPNHRNDYHINPTEEFFYQLEGDMILKIIEEDGTRRDVPIGEGEIFLVPPRVPHRPTRKAHTVGLVVEYARPKGENDHFVWYCDNCGELLHDAEFYLTDLATQIKPEFEKFYASEELRTCKKCGTVKDVPGAPEF
ncbi:MAG: 3-hydroxyanthranilate 3,4-dioxygenase [Gemmatimonadota bacterium]